MKVLKRTKHHSKADLITAIKKFTQLLQAENEDEAVTLLNRCWQQLEKNQDLSQDDATTLKAIQEAFEGDLELEAYTIRRNSSGSDWSAAEELYLASLSVLNLTHRLLKTQM